MTIVFISTSPAYACGGNEPLGVEGQVIFLGDTNVPAYCNGSEWVAMTGGGQRRAFEYTWPDIRLDWLLAHERSKRPYSL